jgi:hypothetical protein
VITLLYVVMLISLPVTFALAVVYFVYLYRFKVAIASDHAETWNKERKNSRPLESWVQSAYRILKRVKVGSLDGEKLSSRSALYARKSSRLLLFGVFAFMLFITSSLALTFVDPMR